VELSQSLSLTGKILQLEVLDMDLDGKSDIVTLDEEGDINIFYGTDEV
jgi:hypothetical protein